MRNRYSTPPAAVVSIPPAFAAKTPLVSVMAKRSSSAAPWAFVAHQLAERKEIMKAGADRSPEIVFSSGAALLFFLKYDFLTEKLSLPFSWNRCSSKSTKQYDRQSSGTSSALSAITWGASTRSRQSSRSKVISPEAPPLFLSGRAPLCHLNAHPGQSHLRTCRKS